MSTNGNNQDKGDGGNKVKQDKRDGVPPRVRAFLSQHAIVPVQRLRIEECSIKPEDALFVTGTLMENSAVKARPLSRSGNGEMPGNHLHDDDAHDGDVHSDDLRDDLNDNERQENGPSDDSQRNAPPRAPAEKPPAPEVVRLAFGAAASSSPHMTQQAKITAALTRAGIATPALWSAAEASSQNGDASVAADTFVRPALPTSLGEPKLAEEAKPAEVSTRLLHDSIAQPAQSVPENEAGPNDDRPNKAHPNKAQPKPARPNDVRLNDSA